MEDYKFNQIKLEFDVQVNEPIEDLRLKMKGDHVVKEEALCDEIKIEIKEEPIDCLEEDSISTWNEYIEPSVNLIVSEQLQNKAVKSYTCEVCNKSFHNKTEIMTHLRVHSIKKIHFCSECNKVFTFPYYLKQHKNITHLGLKPFSCNHCYKTFSHASSLKRHKNTHLGLKPFSCGQCSKTFSHSSGLKQHKNKHLGLKPFFCDQCSKTFSQLFDLKRHKNIHLGLKPFSCDVCNKTFSQSSTLKRHKKTHLRIKKGESV